MDNYERFCSLLRSTNREGVEDLIKWLDTTDAKVAPASTRFHQNYEGGLCEHCLNVYDNLKKVTDAICPDKYTNDSLIIVALLHDLAKVNFYEQYDKNVKVDGQWVQEKAYRYREDPFIFNNHEVTSMFIAQQFIPMSVEEQAAIASHHGGMDAEGTSPNVVGKVYSKYKLAMYLHIADLLDAFSNE